MVTKEIRPSEHHSPYVPRTITKAGLVEERSDGKVVADTITGRNCHVICHSSPVAAGGSYPHGPETWSFLPFGGHTANQSFIQAEDPCLTVGQNGDRPRR